jgi:6-pyruvoyltetrahydropterin/6-carboxytetrahydropterin synthase
MIVEKQFKWEAAHRIPWHTGKCRHLHGHSYKMTIGLEGDTNEQGVVIDFAEIKAMMSAQIAEIDHATIISQNDADLLQVFREKNWRYFLLPYDSTAENLCRYFVDLILREHKDRLQALHIKGVWVSISETDTALARLFAEL